MFNFFTMIIFTISMNKLRASTGEKMIFRSIKKWKQLDVYYMCIQYCTDVFLAEQNNIHVIIFSFLNKV